VVCGPPRDSGGASSAINDNVERACIKIVVARSDAVYSDVPKLTARGSNRSVSNVAYVFCSIDEAEIVASATALVEIDGEKSGCLSQQCTSLDLLG
jgi:hypothetical protein